MNGSWYPWDGFHNGGANGGPAKFVAAYRHIHDVFTSVGPSRVEWVWCPNVGDAPAEPWNHDRNYYPGDDYVDWLCVDGYNWGTTQSWSAWTSFHDIFASWYADFASAGKPILIGEGAPTEGD